MLNLSIYHDGFLFSKLLGKINSVLSTKIEKNKSSAQHYEAPPHSSIFKNVVQKIFIFMV